MVTNKFAPVCACVLGLLVAAGSARAQVPRPLSGKAQFFIGGGLPIPIQKGTPSCVPNGGISGIPAVKSAMVTTTGGVGGSIMIPASQWTLRGPGNPQVPQVQGIRNDNPLGLQVYTNLTLRIPNPGAHIRAGSGVAPFGGAKGRTGPDVVSWCPGYTATVKAGKNPGCINASVHNLVTIQSCPPSPAGCPGPGTAKVLVPGFMKYTRTGKMLGGPIRGTVGGTASGAAAPPAGGKGAVFVKGTPAPSGAIGRSFGFRNQNNAGRGPLHSPVAYNSCGVISAVGPQALSKAASNRTTASFGGPNTQGVLTVKMDTGLGIESYKRTGYDKRTAMGAGNIQLVSGALSLRSATGENANRGQLNLTVPEPGATAGAAAALLALAVCHQLSRRSK